MVQSKIVLPILLIVQFLIYLDRGIVPGSISQINDFISRTAKTSRPNVLLGVLQSSFVIGLSFSCPIIAHFAHTFSPYILISAGIGVWVVGAWMAGLSYHIELYSLLLLGRVLSGVGEAALISLVPPMIMKKAEGAAVGLWMGVFCAMIPIGTAAGYCYGSLLASSVEGWGTAFILEAFIGVPFVLMFLGIATFSSVPLSSQSSNSLISEFVPSPAPPRRVEESEAQTEIWNPFMSSFSGSSTHEIVESELKRTSESCHHDIDTPKEAKQKSGQLHSGSTTGLSAISSMNGYVSFTKGTDCLSILSEDDITDRHLFTEIRSENDDLAILADIASHGYNTNQSFFNDFRAVISSPPFFWLAVGYSAYSATVIAFSTFGSAFLVDLGLLNNETLASVSMGVTVAISGIIGGFAGGGLASFSSKKHLTDESSRNDDDAERYRSEGEIDPMSDQRVIHPYVVTKDSFNRFIELRNLLNTLLPVLIVSIFVLCGATLLRSLWAFLIAVGIGLSGLFSTQAGLNIATMLSVPESQRTCSIAIITLILHLAGDVPSPIIIGLFKDLLAPDCTKTNSPPLGFSLPIFPHPLNSTSNIESKIKELKTRFPSSSAVDGFEIFQRRLDESLGVPSSACRDEELGIRLTMFLTTAWLIWMVIGVIKAKRAATNSLEALRPSLI